MYIKPTVKRTLVDLVKILCIDTAWVVAVIGLSYAVASQLPPTVPDDSVYLIAYLFGAILCAVTVWMKIPLRMIPPGGVYMGALLWIVTRWQLFPLDCLDNWWLVAKPDSLFRLPPISAGAWFCLHGVALQLLVVGSARLLSKYVIPSLIRTDLAHKKSPKEKWLRIAAGQLSWCFLPYVLFYAVRIYALFFTHHSPWTLSVAVTVLIALPILTFSLRTWTALLMSFPITVGLCFLTEYLDPLRSAIGMEPIWNAAKYAPWQSALLLCLTILGLEVLGILQWKLIKRTFVSRQSHAAKA